MKGLCGLRPERTGARLAALAEELDVGRAIEVQIAYVQADDFADACAGIVEKERIKDKRIGDSTASRAVWRMQWGFTAVLADAGSALAPYLRVT